MGICGVLFGALLQPSSVAAATVNDPLYPQQWGLTKIGAEQAWAITRGAGVTVAVIDSGSGPHPDLDANLAQGINLFGGVNEPGAPDVDTQGHGTHVAGIISAVANNGAGVAGVAPESRVLPIRVLGPDGRGRSGDVVAGVRMAADMGARVINLSLGGDQESTPLSEAITYATSKGSLVIAAAGNDGPTAAPKWPAAFDQTIAVAFVDQNNAPGAKSQVGSYIDIAAPGVGIISTALGNYGLSTGSSMAAAYVSGAAALLFAAQPTLTAGQARDILLQSATDIGTPGRDDQTGFGLVNLPAAFAQLAVLFPDSSQPVVAALGRVNENLTVLARPDAKVQWYRCTKPGPAVSKRPANCAAISSAVATQYRTKARDAGTFIRVAITTPQQATPQFSAATPRIMAKWLVVNNVTVSSSTKTTGLLRGPSQGRTTLQLVSGSCALTRDALIAPAAPDTCVVRVRVAARSPFPAMNFLATIAVTPAG
jgi:serine protease